MAGYVLAVHTTFIRKKPVPKNEASGLWLLYSQERANTIIPLFVEGDLSCGNKASRNYNANGT